MTKYFIVGFIQNNTKWYLSTKDAPKGKMYRFVLGIDLATKFSSKEEGEQILLINIKGKRVRGVFTSEFKVQHFEAAG